MNANIEKLHRIANQQERLVIGLMSGTSFDGLDVALCRIRSSGKATELMLLHFETVPYESAFKEELKSVFARKDAWLEKVCLLNPWIALKHAEIVNDCLARWKYDANRIDLLASHGQTIYHAPKSLHPNDIFPNATLQIGDGDHLAVKTGIITISDFRQKHIAKGGEGAPLAIYGDFLLFSREGETRIMLNIGGIANFTYLPADGSFEDCFSTDVGPGNTMMDAYMQVHFTGNYFDKDASVGAKGTVDEDLLRELKTNQFFDQPLPKTTGPELFNLHYLENALQKTRKGSLPAADIMATLNRFTADTIADAIKKSVREEHYKLYLSGGGMHNPLLMQNIRSNLPNAEFLTTDDLRVNPDAKEAVLFALLANECICGHPSMGKISFPE